MERDLNPENNIKLSKEGREIDGLCQTSVFCSSLCDARVLFKLKIDLSD